MGEGGYVQKGSSTALGSLIWATFDPNLPREAIRALSSGVAVINQSQILTFVLHNHRKSIHSPVATGKGNHYECLALSRDLQRVQRRHRQKQDEKIKYRIENGAGVEPTCLTDAVAWDVLVPEPRYRSAVGDIRRNDEDEPRKDESAGDPKSSREVDRLAEDAVVER